MLTDYSELLEWVGPRVTLGCIVEIGALIGTGTRRLAVEWPYKIVYAVDIFDIQHDKTANENGKRMAEYYEKELNGRTQLEAFIENTKKLPNVRTFKGNSRDFPKPEEFVFLAIIDGEHTPEAVRNDFEKVRDAKYIAFHDYQHDIPELTKALDELTEGMERHVLPGWLIIIN